MIALKPPFRADDMQGLYKKVLKGQYPKIKFTDLGQIVKWMLQVKSSKRPDTHELLGCGIIQRKMKELYPEEEEFIYENTLLQTIYFPKKVKNIGYLTDKLPKAMYEDSPLISTKKSPKSRNSTPNPSKSLSNITKPFRVLPNQRKTKSMIKASQLRVTESLSEERSSDR